MSARGMDFTETNDILQYDGWPTVDKIMAYTGK